MFSDESRFSLQSDSRRTLIWRAPGTRYHQENTIEQHRYGGAGWLVWGGIILGSRTVRHVQRVTMTGHIYRDVILEQHVHLFRGAMGAEFRFMDDKARPHRANIIDEGLQSEDITRMDWPSYSPDLNPIEHVLDMLGRRIAAREPPLTCLPELWRALLDEWCNIPLDQIDNLILSMPKRCKEVYGPDIKIKKEECINHVSKRLGTSLRKAVKDWRARGASLGGKSRGSLKEETIKKLSRYYQNAIRSNKGHVEGMKTAIYATLFHSISTDQIPQHFECSSGIDSWRFFQAAVTRGEVPGPHVRHVKTPLKEAHLAKRYPVSLKRKLKKFRWSIDAQEAFDAVKAAITKAPVLKLPDFKKPIELFTDANSISIGEVLNQEQRPVGFGSRTLSNAERSYTVTERECLAVVWAPNKFRTYLGSLPIKVITNHAALTRLTHGQNLSSRLIRWV
ncbi:retrovirus-related Pol polyprotein from transposon 297 [Trichonephila clavipes]|nr:retrovirus-related Pol polyprotein from transposon 297 [Trichonephila clavipes]